MRKWLKARLQRRRRIRWLRRQIKAADSAQLTRTAERLRDELFGIPGGAPRGSATRRVWRDGGGEY